MSLIPGQQRTPEISQACRASAAPGDCLRGCAGFTDPAAGRICEHLCHSAGNPRDLDRALMLAQRQVGR